MRFQQVESFENVRGAVPFHFHTRGRDVLALLGRRRDKYPRVQSEFAKKFAILLFDLAKAFLRVMYEVHFVYDHNRLLNTKHAEQISVAAALFAHPFVPVDCEDRCVCPRCAGDHVLQKLLVPRCIDDGVTAAPGTKRNLRRIDRDILFLLLEQRVKQEREFKLHRFGRAGLFYLVDLAFGERAGVVQDPSNQRRLAMVNVTDENNTQLRLDI